jgi:hypothetical protein
MDGKTDRNQLQQRPAKKKAADLTNVVRLERERFNNGLKVILSALSDLKDYNRGLMSYKQDDPLDGGIAVLLRSTKLRADPLGICCATPAGMRDAVVTVLNINFTPNRRFEVELQSTQDCGIFGYRLSTVVYQFLAAEEIYETLTVPPSFTESGLSGPLAREWSRPLPPLSSGGSFYRIEVTGRIFPSCPAVASSVFAGCAVGVANTSVGPF